MDIERVQKINQLARELLHHGMASDLDEATRKAEETIKGGSDVSEIKQHVEQDEAKKEGAVNIDQNIEMRKMNVKIDDLSKALFDIQNKMGSYVRKIDELEREVNTLKSRSRPVVLEKEKGEEQTNLKPDEKKSGSHPKIGGFDSDDVAVDKIFYCGPKDN